MKKYYQKFFFIYYSLIEKHTPLVDHKAQDYCTSSWDCCSILPENLMHISLKMAYISQKKENSAWMERRLQPHSSHLYVFDSSTHVLYACENDENMDDSFHSQSCLIYLLDLQAYSMLQWHSKTKFCSCCGNTTVKDVAGYKRSCSSCSEIFYPTVSITVTLVI